MVGGAARRVVREGSLSIPEGNAGKRYRRGFAECAGVCLQQEIKAGVVGGVFSTAVRGSES